jgi:NAD(P)-dependent dehydrogenase (short-subunit alcohol dehydrogenase family)
MKAIPDSNIMAGKTCLVTGATSGIGRVTAAALAGQGAELVVAGRNRQKAEETVGWIKSETGNPNVGYLLADFADLEQVRALAAAFRERYSRLDVLINNAGAFFNSRQATPYGAEMTFLVNHLAPFLLTNLLLEELRRSAPARIVNVSSDGYKQATLDLDDLEMTNGFFGMKAYSRSKLANILVTFELARRLEDSGVTANALHPGHVATNIFRTPFPFIGPVLKWVIGLFALSPQEGADNSIYLATSPDVGGITGRYFVKREPVETTPLTMDRELAAKLWVVSERLTGLKC